jgi:hypothetical protein
VAAVPVVEGVVEAVAVVVVVDAPAVVAVASN